MISMGNDISSVGVWFVAVIATVVATGYVIGLIRVWVWRRSAALRFINWKDAVQRSLLALDTSTAMLEDIDATDMRALANWIESSDAALDEVTRRHTEGKRLLAWSFPDSRLHANAIGQIRRRLTFLAIRRRDALAPVNHALQQMIPSVAMRFGELKVEVGAALAVLLQFFGLIWSLSYYAPKGVAVMPLLQRTSDLALIGFTAGIVPLAVFVAVVAYFVWRVMRYRSAALRAGASARTIANALRSGARLSDRTFWIRRSVAALVAFVLVTVATSEVEPFVPRYWLTISGKTLTRGVDVVGGIGDYLVLREKDQGANRAKDAFTILPRAKVECVQTGSSAIISCGTVKEQVGNPPPVPQKVSEFRIAFPVFEIGEGAIRKIDSQQLARGDRLVGVPEKLLTALRECASLDGPIIEIRGFADSACFEKCDSESNVKNVVLANSRANALRQALVDLRLPFLRDLNAGGPKAPNEVGLIVRQWPETDDGHDEMRRASSYEDRDKKQNYRQGAGLLNRRAELLVTNPGSCAVS